MSRSCVHRQIRFGQPAARALAAAALAGFIMLPGLASAQGKSAAQGKSKKPSVEPERKTGKLADVERKGKTSTLTIEEADGEKFDVLVTGKMKFVVNGKGDVEFFKHPKTFVSSDSIFMANGKYFGKKFVVHLGNPPAALLEQDPKNAEVYNIAGPIVDSDEMSFTITANGDSCKVYFEQGAPLDVAVESTDPEHAAVGSAVEVEGNTRLGKFHATSVAVTLDKPLVADVVFADKKPGKKSAKATKKTAKTDKTAKGDSGDAADKADEPSADPVKPTTDPFGLLDKDKKDAKKKPAGTKPKKKPADSDTDG